MYDRPLATLTPGHTEADALFGSGGSRRAFRRPGEEDAEARQDRHCPEQRQFGHRSFLHSRMKEERARISAVPAADSQRRDF